MNISFKKEFFDELKLLEENHFWFKVRNQIILSALKNHVSSMKSFLEIGCGTGVVISAVSKTFPHTSLIGGECFEEAMAIAKQRVPNVQFIKLDAREIPFKSEIAVIGAFDVLEHIKEDTLALNQIHKALVPDGTLILTVPQHQWLWSTVDEYSCHKRRYSRKDLHTKIDAAGFKIVYSTSFVTMLLPAMAIARILKKNKPATEYNARDELNINPLLNKVLECFMSIDAALIRLGVHLPIGGSRLLIARKQ